MLNKVIRTHPKERFPSIVTTEKKVLLSSKKESSLEGVIATLEKKGMWNSVREIALDKIISIRHSEASSNLKIRYLDQENKEKKHRSNFQSEEAANRYGNFLGEHAGLSKVNKAEKKIWPLLGRLFLVLVCAAMVALFATTEDASTFESTQEGYSKSARNARAGGEVLKFLFEAIGATGCIAIASGIGLYILYSAYNRWNHPKLDFDWSRA